MCFARMRHSSCIHSQKLFVIGGMKSFQGPYQGSIEVLDIERLKQWVTIKAEQKSLARSLTMACPFNPSEILIVGGIMQDVSTPSILLLNVIENYLTTYQGSQSTAFTCISKPVCLNEDNCIALVCHNDHVKMIQFMRQGQSFKFKVLHQLGHFDE